MQLLTIINGKVFNGEPTKLILREILRVKIPKSQIFSIEELLGGLELKTPNTN